MTSRSFCIIGSKVKA